VELIFVYNANGGLLNSLLDAGHKMLSPDTYACSLCALTYGSFTERAEWKEFRESSANQFTFLHKDEFESRFEGEFSYPVVLRNGDPMEPLVSTEEINALGSLEHLIDIISERTRPKP
jgi:hypothetical protein